MHFQGRTAEGGGYYGGGEIEGDGGVTVGGV